jgi:hypothetical protein
MLAVRADDYNARHDDYGLEHVQQHVREQASFHVWKDYENKENGEE